MVDLTRLVGARRLSTPGWVRLGMIVAAVPVIVLALVVQLGVSRTDRTLDTVGTEATRGITAAQRLKADLSELDELVVEELLERRPVTASGFPQSYGAARRRLADNLVDAARQSEEGAAFQLQLSNIDYALGHYHALVKDSFASLERDDDTGVTARYAAAHDVAEGTLLPAADSFDKANTYVLNAAYDGHRGDSRATRGVIVTSLVAMVAVLGIVQGLVARKFRRLVNVGLAVATALGLANGLFALASLDDASSSLAVARERAFDAVHELARSRAAMVVARQTEGLLLLDPSRLETSQAEFDDTTAEVFRVPASADAVESAIARDVPDGAGGFLARVVTEDVTAEAAAAARDALAAFGHFVAADEQFRALVAADDIDGALTVFRDRQQFLAVTSALEHAQAMHQEVFDDHAQAAEDAIRRVGPTNLVLGAATLLLIVAGLLPRLREYRT